MEYTLVLTLKGQYDIKTGIWQGVSPEAKDLIAKMLEPDPRLRIELEDALNHPWF
jgi:serine/threonine protein kinase